jgi:putative molybdopterin biosynthesis protein
MGRRGGGTQVRPSAVVGDRPQLRWADLVNQAEAYLLAALGSGHSSQQAQAALSLAIARWEELRREPEPRASSRAGSGPLQFAGSHDLAVELLAQQLPETHDDCRMDVRLVGSLGGLIALARGEADVAGTHLWDAATDSYNLPFVQRVLPGRRLAIVTLAHRALGLILPAGNPQQVSGLADLVRDELRLINRQPGSGTRIWLDETLTRGGVDRSRIAGYEDEATTHLAVAQAVQEGQATAGLGIEAAARAYQLAFVPLAEETYQLVVPDSVWQTRAWQATMSVILSDRYKRTVAALGGYRMTDAGHVAWV